MNDTNTPSISKNQNVGYKPKCDIFVNIGCEFTPGGITIDFQDK